MNLVDVLLAPASSSAGATALVSGKGEVSYGELAALVGRLGTVLVGAGAGPGVRVVIGSENDERFVVAYLAALLVGAVAVPVNPAAPPAELKREIEAVQPGVVLAAGPAKGVLGAAGAQVTAIDLDALPQEPAARVERSEDDVAVMLFTSGTAGAPKAAMLTHGNLAANVQQVLDHPGLRLEASDSTLGALPFFHVFGLNVVLGVALAAGARLVLAPDRFDPAEMAQVVRDRKVTILAGVPTMYEAWLALTERQAPSDTFRSLRLAVSGAAPLPAAVADAFGERFGIELHQGYGLTETAPIVTTTALSGHPKPGSIGPCLPGIEVRLVDDQGDDVLLGDPGEIWVRGPNVFPGYWQDAEATQRALTPEGWLRTGDIAVVDDDGDFRLVDRAKDLIIVSGFNVYPVEVEDVLRTHPDVDDVAVVGEPSARTGETVVAYVVPKDGSAPDTQALLAHSARALARYKCPSRIEVVGEIPRNPAGKVLRRELR